MPCHFSQHTYFSQGRRCADVRQRINFIIPLRCACASSTLSQALNKRSISCATVFLCTHLLPAHALDTRHFDPGEHPTTQPSISAHG